MFIEIYGDVKTTDRYIRRTLAIEDVLLKLENILPVYTTVGFWDLLVIAVPCCVPYDMGAGDGNLRYDRNCKRKMERK